MKNFYYEKCRKPIHYKDLPINRRKVGVHYYYKIRKRWRNTIEKSIVTYKHIPQVITACQTEFVLDITNLRSQGCPRFQSGEELANSVGKINAC